MRLLIDLRKPLKDIVEGLTLLGYAVDNDPRMQQALVLLWSILSAIEAYQEYPIADAKIAPKKDDGFKSAMATVECVMTVLLLGAGIAKNSGKQQLVTLAEQLLRTFGIFLGGRSVLDIPAHGSYSRIPTGIAGFVVGFMPNYSALKRISLGASGVYSFIRGVSFR